MLKTLNLPSSSWARSSIGHPMEAAILVPGPRPQRGGELEQRPVRGPVEDAAVSAVRHLGGGEDCGCVKCRICLL